MRKAGTATMDPEASAIIRRMWFVKTRISTIQATTMQLRAVFQDLPLPSPGERLRPNLDDLAMRGNYLRQKRQAAVRRYHSAVRVKRDFGITGKK